MNYLFDTIYYVLIARFCLEGNDQFKCEIGECRHVYNVILRNILEWNVFIYFGKNNTISAENLLQIKKIRKE